MCLVITWWQISLQTGSTTWASVWIGCTAKQQWLGQRKTIHPLFLNEHIWLLSKTLVMRTKKVCAGSMSRTKKKGHILYMLLNNLNKKDGLYSIPGEDEDWQEPWEWRRRRKSRNLQPAASPHKQFLPPKCRIRLPQLFHYFIIYYLFFYHLSAGSTCHNYDQFHLLSITFHNSNQSTSASLCTLSVQQINTFFQSLQHIILNV